MGKLAVVDQGCFDTREAHVQISINKTVSKQDAVWVNVDGVCRLRVYAAKSIDVEDNRKSTDKPPIFAMSPFSHVVGCGIYRIGDPGKLIAIVPPQFPAEIHADDLQRSKIDHIKIQTERVARLILQALNAS